jgi:hypothetical protein
MVRDMDVEIVKVLALVRSERAGCLGFSCWVSACK